MWFVSPVGFSLSTVMKFFSLQSSPEAQRLGAALWVVGSDLKNLLRIYFPHDDENRRVVVDSLPRYLRVATIQ